MVITTVIKSEFHKTFSNVKKINKRIGKVNEKVNNIMVLSIA